VRITALVTDGSLGNRLCGQYAFHMSFLPPPNQFRLSEIPVREQEAAELTDRLLREQEVRDARPRRESRLVRIIGRMRRSDKQ
jgi:hypothetical protein